jgi:hypothetical protein
LEHHPLVVQFDLSHFGAHYQTVANGLFRACANRPGVTTRLVPGLPKFRVCANLRAIIEWDDWTEGRFAMGTSAGNMKDVHAVVGQTLTALAHEAAPQIVDAPSLVRLEDFAPVLEGQLDDPVFEDEMWATLYLSGSRGFSHEQVRHRYMIAVSQRSTRYCDEATSPYVVHPLLSAYLSDEGVEKPGLDLLEKKLHQSVFASHEVYRTVADRLQAWLVGRGVTATAARKQARGAARGFLGNSLHTEMLFSASVAQWKWMLQLRASDAADAEIRQLYVGTEDGSACVLRALRESQFGASFNGYTVKDAPDGIGRTVS